MLVTCSYCGGHHKRGLICPQRPPKPCREKEANYITRFRSSKAWQKQRAYIRQRDKQLCQFCLQKGKYTFSSLQVHHIEAISKKWTKRLDENNLVTLCTQCHSMAENGNILAKDLREIVKNAPAF